MYLINDRMIYYAYPVTLYVCCSVATYVTHWTVNQVNKLIDCTM